MKNAHEISIKLDNEGLSIRVRATAVEIMASAMEIVNGLWQQLDDPTDREVFRKMFSDPLVIRAIFSKGEAEREKILEELNARAIEKLFKTLAGLSDEGGEG